MDREDLLTKAREFIPSHVPKALTHVWAGIMADFALSVGEWKAIKTEADLPESFGRYYWTRRACQTVDLLTFNPMSAADRECHFRDYAAVYSIPVVEPKPYAEEVNDGTS